MHAAIPCAQFFGGRPMWPGRRLGSGHPGELAVGELVVCASSDYLIAISKARSLQNHQFCTQYPEKAALASARRTAVVIRLRELASITLVSSPVCADAWRGQRAGEF